MTAISLGQAAHRRRLSRTAATGAIKVGPLPSDTRGCLVGPAQLRGQFEVTDITSQSQEFAGGFVDFLLGRGAHHPR
jgi:hypothetical protein